MTRLLFENPGEIDVRAVTTLGVCVKETENPIGQFGTGLKYAIAVLLRTGHDVAVFSGVNEYRFGVAPTEIRGETFDVVTMNDAPLGFTTALGAGWETWMAYRELVCNALDESGETRVSHGPVSGTPGTTRVVVDGDALLDVHARRRDYFFDPAALVYENEHVQVARGPSDAVFYRGVRVGTPPGGRPALYRYNILDRIDLTEDRTVRHDFDVHRAIGDLLVTCDDPIVIHTIATAGHNFYEGRGYFTLARQEPAQTFMREVATLMRDRPTDVAAETASVFRKHEDARTPSVEPRPWKMDSVARRTLARAVGFCERIGYDVDRHEMRVVEKLGDRVHARATRETDTIHLAREAFGSGAKHLVGVLIEEHFHLVHGYGDCTREMQNHLVDELVSMAERAVGEPI